MKTSGKLIKISNLITMILFLLPVSRLDLFRENYSTLSLSTRGYFFLLFLGIICGLLMAYETLYISGRRNAVLIFAGLILGTAVPHHVPYDLQGNLHLILAYIGFFLMFYVTYVNSFNTSKKIFQQILSLLIVTVSALYMKYMMINTLSEIIIMIACLSVNLSIYLEKR